MTSRNIALFSVEIYHSLSLEQWWSSIENCVSVPFGDPFADVRCAIFAFLVGLPWDFTPHLSTRLHDLVPHDAVSSGLTWSSTIKKSIQPSIRCNKLRKLAAETCPSEPRFVLKKINESFHPFCYFWSHLDSGVLSSFMRSHSASHICRAVEWYSPYRWHFRIDDMFDLTMVVSTTTTMHTGCSSLKSYKERGMVALSL